jgi:hypothetical protein
MGFTLKTYTDFALDRMQYGQPSKKHAKKLAKGPKLDKIQLDWTHVPSKMHPVTSSGITRAELICQANDISAMSEDEQEAIRNKHDEDFLWHFEDYCKQNDLDYDEEYYKQLVKEAKYIILAIKYKFNRPRPYQAAPVLGIDLNVSQTPTASSPSYPSGHSAQSSLVANVLSKLYPEHTQAFENIADQVSYSRYIGGLHYKSDLEYGKEVGEFIANHTIKP